MRKIGIIVGRFQTPYLHDGHKALIDYVKSKSDITIIFVGAKEPRLTINNPLSYNIIREMLLNYNEGLVVSKISDNKSDIVWSKNLDLLISAETNPGDEIILYGSRDSFIRSYHGIHKTQYADIEILDVSSTKIRSEFHKKTFVYDWFRAGIIHASAHKYPTSYQTVDVAVTNFDHYKLLLGRKRGCEKYQFIGGFVDTTDDSLELSAKREVIEECGMIETSNYRYIGSYRIDDWRYRNESDKIMTAFFCCHFVYGSVKANDDMEEVKWFDIPLLTDNDFEPEHRHLFLEYKKYINTHIKH